LRGILADPHLEGSLLKTSQGKQVSQGHQVGESVGEGKGRIGGVQRVEVGCVYAHEDSGMSLQTLYEQGSEGRRNANLLKVPYRLWNYHNEFLSYY
jgi:hypothetical protein